MSGPDAELLDRLQAALELPRREPSVAEVAALRNLVDEHHRRPAVVLPFPAWLRSRPGRRAVVAAAVAATLIVGSGAVAVAVNGPFAGPARRAAGALGLPVDSPELVKAKDALAALASALAGHDDRRITAARQDLARRLADLSGDDARGLSPKAQSLLREADERLGAGPDQHGRQPTGGNDQGGGASSPDDHESLQGATGGDPHSAPREPAGPGSDSGRTGPTPTAPEGGSGPEAPSRGSAPVTEDRWTGPGLAAPGPTGVPAPVE